MEPIWASPPKLMVDQLGREESSRCTIGWVLRSAYMTLLARCNEVYYLAHSVSNESLETARITIQPSKNHCAVSPRVNVTGGEFQCSLDIREYL